MKLTTQQQINIGNGAKRIRNAINETWVMLNTKPDVGTNCRTMFSERNGMHTLLSPKNEKYNQKNAICVQEK